MARGTCAQPPNTLAGIDAALAAGATRIEIDVRPLRDRDFLLYHDRALPGGRAIRETAADDGMAEGLPKLSQAVQRLADNGATLQIDLKEETPLGEEMVERLLRLIAPLGGRVVVGSMIDWNLRALRAAAPQLALGFDPLIYFHHWEERPDDVPFPRQRGVYGYWDDHPLAALPLLPLAEYLGVRFEAFAAAVAQLDEIMLHWPTLLRALEDGLDVVGFFHARKVKVLAWTLDAGTAAEHHLPRLAAAGVDAIVTNTAPEFGRPRT